MPKPKKATVATRDYHPARIQRAATPSRAGVKRRSSPFTIPSIPTDAKEIELDFAGRVVRLTNLRKPFWPELGIAKRDLIQYYADVSPALVPHLADRAMVMKS